MRLLLYHYLGLDSGPNFRWQYSYTDMIYCCGRGQQRSHNYGHTEREPILSLVQMGTGISKHLVEILP